tara:strand:+ start:172 stop:429 length:258 start_codon:yes stop_codon:yes gene_type:complete
MRKLNEEEQKLETKYIQNPIKFSTAIEKFRKESGGSYIESIIQYCIENSIDLEVVGKLVTSNLREKVEAEATSLNFLPKTGILPI